MKISNCNRYRVSSKFTVVKLFAFIGLFSIAVSAIRDINHNALNQSSLVGLIFGTALCIGLLYFVRTRKQIEYDDIEHILYVIEPNKESQEEIPVEKIEKILYSTVGLGKGSYSYVIVYRDFHNQEKKVRLFPIPFRNDIDTIITDTQLKNPDLKTRSWSIGWNEFFD